MAKKNNFYNACLTLIMLLVFTRSLHAQDIQQYWSNLNPDQMSLKVDGDQIKVCTAIKMLILPEAKKIAAYNNNANDIRYMGRFCPAEEFFSYANLLEDLQKDILTTQNILKSSFEKEWSIESLQIAFIKSFASGNKQNLNCYAPDLELSADQKYILYLAIMELHTRSLFGVVINDTSQRKAILSLFERVFGVKSNINGRYMMDPILAEMILQLKKEALLEAREYQIISPEVFEELSLNMFDVKN